MVEAEALGVQREFPQLGPEAVLGIEINPYAAELARVSVWIGHIQWARRHGYPPPSDPVLRRLDTIECRDAVLSNDGQPAEWPVADVIVGNPPFLGTKKQFSTLGVTYTKQLRDAYSGRIPGFSDLVCYWFERACEQIKNGFSMRAGLVATDSIKSGENRVVLDRLQSHAPIRQVWSSEPWTIDGASVRVSLICFEREANAFPLLNGKVVLKINSDLTAETADLTTAKRLMENACVAFMATVKGGPFDIPGFIARDWLREPTNPNGRSNSEVLKPYANGIDVTRRPSDTWVVDFGVAMTEAQAQLFIQPFAHVLRMVKPVRDQVRRKLYRERWWLYCEPCSGMRRALLPLPRFIVTSAVAKHRVFAWMQPPVLPDHALIVIARDDDTTFGILQSKHHGLWAAKLGSALEDRPRYTHGTTFETFPFPEGLTPDHSAAAYAHDPRAKAIATATCALVFARDRWLNPPELVERVPEVVPGFPDRLLPRNAAAEVVLRRRTLTALYNTRGMPEGAWLDGLHHALDSAVAAAYGWPAGLPDDEVLARLLALNHERSRRRAKPK